jgi:subtilisin family serine protease
LAGPVWAQEASDLQLVEGTASVQKPKAAEATYIVRLKEAPAVAYDGGIPGLKPTRPAKGKKIDPESQPVMDYVAYLQARHDAVLAQNGGGQKLHSYGYAFNGFAAKMSAKQAKALASSPAVLNVWKDEERHLETNRTPIFLGLTAPGGLWEQLGGVGRSGEDIIIGMVDSGFWPENPSFSDRDSEGKLVYQNIPHWPGKCHPGEAFNASMCNQKVIGARYYNTGFGGDAAVKARYPNDFNSPRDGSSHGSHTASTAGGNNGVQALVNGVNLGAISGMAPRARLSIYKTCYGDGATSACFTSDSVAAIDQAVADGVDVLNYSISGSTTSNVDAVEVAFLFAVDAGVFVAASAGNSGPTASTVAHNSPWMTTVAAGTHDRLYASGAKFGTGPDRFGVSVANGTPMLPLVRAEDARLPGADVVQARQCWSDNTGGGLVSPPQGPPGPRLDPALVAGKIVVCERGVSARVDKSLAVKNAGGLGMILVNPSANTIDPDLHSVPTVHMQNTDHDAVLAYAMTAGATAQLLPGTIIAGVAAPDVASFSSRGPALSSGGDMLKPDIMAPGVAILAATSPASPANGGHPFDFLQGTSMSSPHIAGIAALFKQRHPDWSPAMIKSALMTTASQLRNTGTPIAGTAFDKGAGQVNANGAVDPGLVYDAGFNDWVKFLCGTGEITGCTAATTIDPSDLNYPTISIGSLAGQQTVSRTVKNVSNTSATYALSAVAPTGITVAFD